jgi:hypothetical protein
MEKRCEINIGWRRRGREGRVDLKQFRSEVSSCVNDRRQDVAGRKRRSE